MDELQAYLDALKGQQSMTHQAEPPPDAVQHFVQQAPAAVGAFASGGLHGLAKQQGVQTPEWSQHVADFFNKPGVQDATSMLGPNLGIFTGFNARNFSSEAWRTAQKLLRDGKSPEHIFDKTGMFQDVEGNWKSEISDQGMMPKKMPIVPKGSKMQGAVGNLVDHPELFKAYPSTQHLRVDIDPTYGSEKSAAYYPGSSHQGAKIVMGGEINPGGLSDKAQSSLLHELGHHIQSVEGWPLGGNPDWVRERVTNAVESRARNLLGKSTDHPDMDKLAEAYTALTDPKMREQLGARMYWNLPGETEARNIENRFLLGRAGQPMYTPKTTPHEEMVDYLRNNHNAYLLRSGEKGGTPYYMKDVDTNELINPNTLPKSVRAAYDRLPAKFGPKFTHYEGSPVKTGWDVPTHMLGDPKYPWKTEDIPKEDQYNYLLRAALAGG